MSAGLYDRLRQAELDYQDACEAAETARDARDDLVREAVKLGYSHAEITDALGPMRTHRGKFVRWTARDLPPE